MKSPKIIYLVTRAHGLKQHLLKPEDIMRLLRAKNIVEMFDLLLKTEYSTELSKVSLKELDAYQLERIFYRKLSDRFAYLFQITSGKIREVLEDYYRQIEVENVKRIIRAIHGKEKITEDELIPFPRRYQTVNYQALLESRTIKEIVGLLKETPYKDLADGIPLYEKHNNPIVLEARLDGQYYGLLWTKLGKMSDKRKVKALIGTEIDLRNLLFILALKHMKMEPEILREMIIDVHHKLPKSIVPKLVDASYGAIPGLLTWPPYVELAKKAVILSEKEMFTEVEHLLLQHLYVYAQKESLRNPNSLVYVFSYLQMCTRETKNLTTLALGKQLKLDGEKIESLLFL